MATRQIALDTETTGLDPKDGHRVIEIGAIEIVNRRVTDNYFHVYINPQRNVEAGALAVHGLSDDFLKDKPLFADIKTEFLRFLSDADLIIHNAPFDLKFLHHELRLDKTPKPYLDKSNPVIDTLVMARERHPGQRNNLDALCKRYDVDNSGRELHGALMDARLLAYVYLAMTGGQSCLFEQEHVKVPQQRMSDSGVVSIPHNVNTPIIYADESELLSHHTYLDKLTETNGELCAWKREET